MTNPIGNRQWDPTVVQLAAVALSKADSWLDFDALTHEAKIDYRRYAGAVLDALSEARLLLPADMHTEPCRIRHPDFQDVRCDRPAMHNHHGGNDADGVTRELWLDSHPRAVAP